MKQFHPKTRLSVACIGVFLSLSTPIFSAAPIYVTSPNDPSSYEPLNQAQADRSIAILRGKSNQTKGVTARSMIASQVAMHQGQALSQGNSLLVNSLIPLANINVTKQNQTLTQSIAAESYWISSCQTITKPGTYYLTQNISAAQGSCLNLVNVSGVTIIGRGFTIAGGAGAAINISNGSNIEIQQCDIKKGTGGQEALTANNTQDLTVRDSTLERLSVDHSQRVQIINNHILGSLHEFYSTNVLIADNTIDQLGVPDSRYGMYMSHGNNNQILRNHIEGGWDGNLSNWGNQGADNAVLLYGEDSDLVQGNDMQNFFNVGIEGADTVSNTLIEGNTIRNAAVAGIAEAYGTSWINNTVRGNRVSQSPQLILLVYAASVSASADVPTQYYFQNNVFENNTLTGPVLGRGGNANPSSTFSLFYPAALNATLGNNMIRNNNFGTQTPGPTINPRSAFIDGGGNTCSRTGTTLACVSSSRLNAMSGPSSPQTEDTTEETPYPQFLPPPPQILFPPSF